ncbi:MAG: hypothetical protein ABEI27_04025 [Halobellus sp.]|uniref:hypothetical protein n=1 Tax=Halobellus sp. TaxID=1979212 RepID=UPI0035D50F31
MSRRNRAGTALVGLAVVLFVAPALFPVGPVLVHDTRGSAPGTPAEIRERGIPVVAYGNLSERAQELYVTTLENGGEYRVARGRGAPAFDYPTVTEVRRARENGSQSTPGRLVIERPADDAHLPPADERAYVDPEEVGAVEDGEVNETRVEQARERAQRYDLVETRTGDPPLGSTPQLLRLASVLLAVVSLGAGGYLRSSK